MPSPAIRHGLAAALVAVVAIAVPVASESFFYEDGYPRPSLAGIAIGITALLLVAASWRTRWRNAAALFALALAAQACTLGLIRAPNYCVFQHWMGWAFLRASREKLYLVAPLVQGIVALAAILEGRERARVIASAVPVPTALALAALVVVAAAYNPWDLSRHVREVILGVVVVATSAANLVMVARAIPEDALMGWRSESSRYVPIGPAIWVVGASAAISWFVFDGVPHIPDAIGHLFQAKYHSVGLLHLPAPPDPEAFVFEKLHSDGEKWWSYSFPGWPVVLAVGVKAGVPWLVNPILGGLTVILTHAVVRRFYDEATARSTVLLLAVSPWFLFMSATQMPHPLAALLALLTLFFVARERATPRGVWGFAAGATLGALFLTRPLDAVGVSLGIGAFCILRGSGVNWRGLAGMTVGGLLIGSLVFPFAAALTGDPTLMPHELWANAWWYPGADRLGFGPDVGNLGWRHLDPWPGHGWRDALTNVHQNVFLANIELFGWGFGSLVFAAWALFSGPKRREDRLFLLVIGGVVIAYCTYWFGGGPDLGARYWYHALVPLVILTVRGVQMAIGRATTLGGPVAARRLVAFVVVASAVAMPTFTSWRATGKYHRYRDMSADVRRLADEHGFAHDLVFVSPKLKEDYPSAMIWNPPTLDAAGTIYAIDLGPERRAALSRHFPDRRIWLIGRRTDKSRHLEILSGPHPPAENH